MYLHNKIFPKTSKQAVRLYFSFFLSQNHHLFSPTDPTHKNRLVKLTKIIVKGSQTIELLILPSK